MKLVAENTVPGFWLGAKRFLPYIYIYIKSFYNFESLLLKMLNSVTRTETRLVVSGNVEHFDNAKLNCKERA